MGNGLDRTNGLSEADDNKVAPKSVVIVRADETVEVISALGVEIDPDLSTHVISFRGDEGTAPEGDLKERESKSPEDERLGAAQRIYEQIRGAILKEAGQFQLQLAPLDSTPWDSSEPGFDDAEFRLGVFYAIRTAIDRQQETQQVVDEQEARIMVTIRLLMDDVIELFKRLRPKRTDISAVAGSRFPWRFRRSDGLLGGE